MITPTCHITGECFVDIIFAELSQRGPHCLVAPSWYEAGYQKSLSVPANSYTMKSAFVILGVYTIQGNMKGVFCSCRKAKPGRRLGEQVGWNSVLDESKPRGVFPTQWGCEPTEWLLAFKRR